VRALNAQFCEIHARAKAKERHRKYNGKRGVGERQSSPPVALANQSVGGGETPHPGILAFPEGSKGQELPLERPAAVNGSGPMHGKGDGGSPGVLERIPET
jgi:hypothetical protein